MTTHPRLLDLFCGQGGEAERYENAQTRQSPA